SANWRSSERRRKALHELGPLAKCLTEPPGPKTVGLDFLNRPLQALARHLSTPRNRSVLLVGPAGTGQTALGRMLAQRVLAAPETLPAPLRDLDVLELAPDFPRCLPELTAGHGPGQDLVQVRNLFRHLEVGRPNLVLFVDRLYSFLTTLLRLSVYREFIEAFKRALDAGGITCVG